MLNQAYIFIIFVLNGFIIGLLFDLFRILRKSFKTVDIITYLEDFMFWILTGFILLYSVFKFSNGEIRLYIFLGVILGTILYILAFSKIFVKISVNIILFVKKLINIVIIRPIIKIYKLLQRLITKPIKFIFINFKKMFANVKKHIFMVKKVN